MSLRCSLVCRCHTRYHLPYHRPCPSSAYVWTSRDLKCVLRSTVGGNTVLLKDARQVFCQSAGTREVYRENFIPCPAFFLLLPDIIWNESSTVKHIFTQHVISCFYTFTYMEFERPTSQTIGSEGLLKCSRSCSLSSFSVTRISALFN